ncbi:MAG: VTT domain-containing protein [Nitrososphaerota archaeon]|nr:VTT domain-containing protein [Candidatus Bathyarchaeota archaeon]MDW8049106.1 VTT domain-containing protein [Nitrososphaerota archaeon]
MDQIDQWLREVAIQYGYVGIFAVSFIGASSVIIPIPYTLIVFFMGKILDPLLVALSAGTGSALGELFGYLLGFFGRAAVSEERKKKMEYMVKIFDRYGATMIIFLFALLPLPDDLLFIPLGIMRYNFFRAFLPAFAGKILMCLILAYGGRLSISAIEVLLGGEGGIFTMLATAILLIIIVCAMLKIDWEKLFPLKGEKEG